MSTSISNFENRSYFESVDRRHRESGAALRALTAADLVIMTFSLVALSISGYLAWTKFTASKVAGCGSGGVIDCSHVLTTRWATFMGMPVGVYAAGLYAILMVAILVKRYSTAPRSRATAGLLIFSMGLAAGLAAVWFMSLQVFAIGHLCPWCMAAHVCGLGVAATLIWSRPFDRRLPRLPLAIAVAGIAVLISGQLLAEPPATYEVQRFESVGSQHLKQASDSEEQPQQAALFEAPVFEAPVFEAPDPVDLPDTLESTSTAEDGASTARERSSNVSEAVDGQAAAKSGESTVHEAGMPVGAMLLLLAMLCQTAFVSGIQAQDQKSETVEKEGSEKPSRQVSLAGKARLNVADWPLAGSLDAKHIFVEMFDYTCPHCRSTHQTALKDLKKRFGDDVAYVALCVPLDADCNKFVQATSAEHAEACELGRLAVAVWLADRKKFPEFHDWLFDGQHSRRVSEARRKAVALVGEERLQKMRATSTCSKYIERNVELYELVGAGSVPKLIFDDSIVVGTVGSADAIIEALQ